MTRKNYLVLLPLIVLFLLFLLPSSVSAQTAPQITLEASKVSLVAGDPLTITVNLETGAGNQVNSFIVSLKYPQDKLDFQSIDTDTSPFNMSLQSTGGNGEVKIIRGSVKSLTGKVLVGKVNFKAKSAVQSSSVTVSNDSAIIRSSDNTNILPGSTVQNTAGSSSHSMPSMTPKTADKFSGFFSRIKNFFFSFFK